MKQIVIIGGSGGLGKKLTLALQERSFGNYSVLPVSSRGCNIAYFKECKEFFETNKADIVINIAGKNYDKFVHKITQEDSADICNLIDVNVRGTVHIAATCLNHMREQGYGRLIYISSVLATQNVFGTAAYSASKAFIDKFVKVVSKENIRMGVTVNSIQLGYFDGGLTDKLPYKETYKEQIGLKRWGTIDELADTIEYIINTEYLTGANIELNGGI